MPSRTPAYEEEQRLIEQEQLLIEITNYRQYIHETKQLERVELHIQRKILCNELINIYLKAYYRRVEKIVSEDSPFAEQIIHPMYHLNNNVVCNFKTAVVEVSLQ